MLEFPPSPPSMSSCALGPPFMGLFPKRVAWRVPFGRSAPPTTCPALLIPVASLFLPPSVPRGNSFPPNPQSAACPFDVPTNIPPPGRPFTALTWLLLLLRG